MKDPNWLRQVSPKKEAETPEFTLNPNEVDRMSCSVKGKTVLRHDDVVSDNGELMLSDLEPILKEHGRKAVITFKMKDGSKVRVRGNGSLMLENKPTKMTAYAKSIIRQDKYHPMRESIIPKLGRRR